MYYDEMPHVGRPHFHATYGDDEASIDIEGLALLAGGLPARARRLIAEWAAEHQDDGYRVRVVFEDGTDGEVDLGYLTERGGVFAPLRDAVFFARLRADRECGTIVWPNDADIAPETLYGQAARGRLPPRRRWPAASPRA